MIYLDKVSDFKIPQMRDLYKTLFLKGKGLRANITTQVAGFLNISEKQKQKLARIVEYIHHSSILHDDVIDISPVRRGGLSTWMQFSMKKSVLAGDYLLAQAAMDTADMNNLPLMKLTAQVLKKLVVGEWMQNSLKTSRSEVNLRTVHELKTASLFQWCLKAPFLVSGHYSSTIHKCLDRIGLLIGILFQRADDLLDFDIRNYEKKIIFTDLKEGYINSFAVFLSKSRNKNFISVLKTCRTLKEVKQCIGGEHALQQAVSKFDAINSRLIQSCHRQVDFLGKNLTNEITQYREDLVKELKCWSNRLYWRRNV